MFQDPLCPTFESFHSGPVSPLSTAPANEWNRETRQDARTMMHSLLRFPLIVALALTREVLLITKALSIKLQGTYMDIVRAHEEIELVKRQVKSNRDDVDGFHQRVYDAAVTLAGEVGLSEETPRVVGRQQHRTNPQSDSPCEFYRRSTTVPLLDHLQTQLEERFSSGSQNAIHLRQFMAILPCSLGGRAEPVTRADLTDVLTMYQADLPSPYAIDIELQAWYLKWNRNKDSAAINTAPKALKNADEDMFPNIATLLRLAATLPVTSATCERSISTLRLIKTHLRSSMTNARMNGLAMMLIHREWSSPESLKLEKVIDEFAARHPRRMELSDLGARQDTE